MYAKQKSKYFLALLPFFVITVLFEVIPLLMIIFKSFMPMGSLGFTLEHYISVFTKPLYLKAISNSLMIALISSLAGIVIAFFGAKAAHSASGRMKNFFLTILNMTSNFAGVPLAFAYMVLLGNSGVMVLVGKQYGIDFLANFNLYSGMGITLIYVYFQIPLSTLLLVPAFEGVRDEWKEANALLGGNSTQFWTKVGIPVLLPSVLGTLSVLFANALAAYATAYALVMNNYAMLPITISGMFVGDIMQREELGSALSVVMMVLMCLAIGINNYIVNKNTKGGVKK